MKRSNNNTEKQRHSKVTRTLYFGLKAMLWVGAIILYYIVFSLFFDTPTEHRMKRENQQMLTDYNAMAARYDSLQMVLQNIEARDKNIFHVLFESDPYDFDNANHTKRIQLQEQSSQKSSQELHILLNAKIDRLERLSSSLDKSWKNIIEQSQSQGDKLRHIPAIQPVINNDLTLLTAGYGTIINPFYQKLKSHQGVDFSVGEGSSVFATADGVVKEISDKSSTHGKTIVIDHGNGYETSYSHLYETFVKRGQQVRRRDVIALSGNSGLSLAPHLHYEVRYNDMRVNPIHFFFLELTPEQYQRIIQISQSGMQSLD